MMRKIATVLIALGIFGLVIGFRVLIRDQWGAGLYSAGGVILLVIGGLLHVLNFKGASNKSTSAKRGPTLGDDAESGQRPETALK